MSVYESIDRAVKALESIAMSLAVIAKTEPDSVAPTPKPDMKPDLEPSALLPPMPPPEDGSPTSDREIDPTSRVFLWKPRSDNSKKLVVLTPSRWNTMAHDAWVEDSSGRKHKDSGRRNLNGISKHNANGNRRHFWFNRAGEAYGSPAYFVVQFRDGTVKRITIQNPGRRTEIPI